MPIAATFIPHTMKTLLTILTLQIPLLITAQNPTIFFDKTRCQRKLTMEFVTTLPHSILLIRHLESIIPRRQLAKPTEFSLWKLDGKTFIKIQQGSIHEACKFPSAGKYFLQIDDRIHSTFVEWELKQGQLKSAIYYNCEIHD